MQSTVPASELRLVLFLGGPSAERDISLDSARTFFDAVRSDVGQASFVLVHVAGPGRFFRMPWQWVYSNSVEDYLHAGLEALSMEEVSELIRSADVLCPFVHGAYGEDGELAKLFEAEGRSAFLGAGSEGLALTMAKDRTLDALERAGYPVTPRLVVDGESGPEMLADLPERLAPGGGGRWVVKPTACGSSDGVAVCAEHELPAGLAGALAHGPEALIEPFIVGTEFSLVVIEDSEGAPLPFFPTEVELLVSGERDFYSRLRKYMPGYGVRHHTPARFAEDVLAEVRSQGARVFTQLGLRDWGRLDGFLARDGRILWTDINGAPGFGMDSLLFQQAALFGLGARSLCWHVLDRALAREGRRVELVNQDRGERTRVAVLGGGATSERHVSRMSWLNVSTKLEATGEFDLERVFVSRTGQLWHVPRFLALQHTVEEIEALLEEPSSLRWAEDQAARERVRLFESPLYASLLPTTMPREVRLEDLRDSGVKATFLAMHGGAWEDGSMQAQLTKLGLAYNGSGPGASRTGMDKRLTAEALQRRGYPGLFGMRQKSVSMADLALRMGQTCALESLSRVARVEGLQAALQAPAFEQLQVQAMQLATSWMIGLESPAGVVLKPRSDGCSSAVLVATDPRQQLPVFLLALLAGLEAIPQRLLHASLPPSMRDMVMQLPSEPLEELLVERFLGGSDDFTEITCGVVECGGALRALVPSETPTQFGQLTLEEKFCKGMGANLTPPPSIATDRLASIRLRIEVAAQIIGLEGYARIDAIYQHSSDALHVIEVNTLPGLSAATVLFTQALVTEELQLAPPEFLGHLVHVALARVERNGAASTQQGSSARDESRA